MFQGDCKLQAAGLDRVQWAFVELMVVDLEEDRVRPMEASAKHSLPVVFPCSPAALLSLNLAAQAGLLWLTSGGVHGGLTVRVQGSGRELREGFGCMMT